MPRMTRCGTNSQETSPPVEIMYETVARMSTNEMGTLRNRNRKNVTNMIQVIVIYLISASEIRRDFHISVFSKVKELQQLRETVEEHQGTADRDREVQHTGGHRE